jgi:hypothetical protein
MINPPQSQRLDSSTTATPAASTVPVLHARPRSTAPVGLLVAGSLATGRLAALVLVADPVVPAQESGVTGAVLGGFVIGWAMSALLSARFSARRQCWAAVQARFMGWAACC